MELYNREITFLLQLLRQGLTSPGMSTCSLPQVSKCHTEWLMRHRVSPMTVPPHKWVTDTGLFIFLVSHSHKNTRQLAHTKLEF